MSAISRTLVSRTFSWIKIFNFNYDFTEICSLWPHWQCGSTGSDNGLAPDRRQSIIWTNDALGSWRIYASHDLNELRYKSYLKLRYIDRKFNLDLRYTLNKNSKRYFHLDGVIKNDKCTGYDEIFTSRRPYNQIVLCIRWLGPLEGAAHFYRISNLKVDFLVTQNSGVWPFYLQLLFSHTVYLCIAYLYFNSWWIHISHLPIFVTVLSLTLCQSFDDCPKASEWCLLEHWRPRIVIMPIHRSTVGCHNVNRRCHKWRQRCHYENCRLSEKYVSSIER